MSHFIHKVLPKADADAYAAAKFKVQAHNQSAKVWWTAIAAIKDNEWYLTEFATFGEWCEKYSTWSPGIIRMALSDARKSQADDLIASTTGEIVIREPKQTRVNVSKPQVATCASDTSRSESKNNSYTHETPTKPAKASPIEDENGTIIPESLLPIWNRRHEVQALMSRVSDLKSEIDQLRNSGDKLFVKIDQIVVEKLASVYQLLKEAKPHSVCGICNGRLEIQNNFCKSCRSTGFMNEREYVLLVPEESRKIKERENAGRKSK